MDNWWIATGNQNMLKGVPGDAQNPAKLPDDYIVDFYSRIPQAKTDFHVLYPSLLPEERNRLSTLLADNPQASLSPMSPRDREDAFQKNWNTAGIYTTGPLGGRGYGR